MVNWLVIKAVYTPLTNHEHYMHDGDKLITDWYHTDLQTTNPQSNAFYRNLATLMHEVKADSTACIVAPFIYNAAWPGLAPEYMNGIAHNIELLKLLAEKEEVTFCSFTAEMISDPANWIDDCHLSEAGIRDKAIRAAECILNEISRMH